MALQNIFKDIFSECFQPATELSEMVCEHTFLLTIITFNKKPLAPVHVIAPIKFDFVSENLCLNH